MGRKRSATPLEQLSTSTKYRRRKEFYHSCLNEESFTTSSLNADDNSNDNSNDNYNDNSNDDFDSMFFSNDSDNEIDFGENNQINEALNSIDRPHDGLNSDINSIDCPYDGLNSDINSIGELFNLDVNLVQENEILLCLNSPDRDDQEKLSNLLDHHRTVLNQLINLYISNKINKSVLNSIIKLMRSLIKDKEELKSFPTSFYSLYKLFKSNVNITFSFICDCNQTFTDYKQFESIYCNGCDKLYQKKDIILSKKYFFKFNLTEQLKILLNNFELTNDYPGRIFKKFLNEKKDVCTVSIFIDGVPIFKRFQLWPFIIKINNLVAPEESKNFLYGCLISDKKPEKETIEFFFKDLIPEIELLEKEGIYLEKKKKKVFVVFTLFLFDSQARPLFLYHANFNGKYGCHLCLNKGETHKHGNGHSHIYLAEVAELRTLDLHNDILKLIKDGQITPPILGVKGESPIFRISYINHLDSVTPEPMHMLWLGIIKSIFSNILSSKGYPCHINSKKLELLDKRIQIFSKFTFCSSIFKRKIENFSNFNFKANQFFQFFTYVFPIVSKDLLDPDVYNLMILLNYILTNLYSKEETEIDLSEIEKLIEIYLKLLVIYFPLSIYTFNQHQMFHLVKFFENHGKLELNQAFFFEHLNGVTKQQVSSSFGILEQIAERSDLKFELNSKLKLKEKSKIFKISKKNEQIVKVTNDFLTLSLKKSNISKDYYVMCNDSKFYELLEFYNLDDELFVKAKEFKIIDNFHNFLNFSQIDLEEFENYQINLDYIFNVEQTQTITHFNTQTIKEKVLYIPKFKEKSSDFLDELKGYIIRCHFKLHN